mmetsp:Transcript_19049/g.52911  ORF Transcript_19049/g.52911 Transcript_19049/m.52911 type:complete len:228 (-) Transcript_19049:730-1413(-)
MLRRRMAHESSDSTLSTNAAAASDIVEHVISFVVAVRFYLIDPVLRSLLLRMRKLDCLRRLPPERDVDRRKKAYPGRKVQVGAGDLTREQVAVDDLYRLILVVDERNHVHRAIVLTEQVAAHLAKLRSCDCGSDALVLRHDGDGDDPKQDEEEAGRKLQPTAFLHLREEVVMHEDPKCRGDGGDDADGNSEGRVVPVVRIQIPMQVAGGAQDDEAGEKERVPRLESR